MLEGNGAYGLGTKPPVRDCVHKVLGRKWFEDRDCKYQGLGLIGFDLYNESESNTSSLSNVLK